MTDEPLYIYSSGLVFDSLALDGTTVAKWMERVEEQLARREHRAIQPVNRATLQADVLASAVLAMQNVDDMDGNEGELAVQVHRSLRQTYTRWLTEPPSPPYFKSRLLDSNPDMARAYMVEFRELKEEQRKVIDSLVEAFLDAHATAMKG